ncbi:hypothetical protein [Sphingomonas montana]|uniref:hypothetical protein n=1 Tax=Sphingomonas montana TaxID=1843236 RepID=UPI00096C44E3|nr:hypothetical protein [Sphingomonas montana]
MTTATRRGRRTTGAWVQAAVDILRGLPAGCWLTAALVVIGVTLFRLAAAPVPGEAPAAWAASAGIVQLVVLLLLNFALYRVAGGVRPAVAVGAPLLRFGAVLAGTILFTLLPLAVARALVPANARLADIWLWSFAATTFANLLLLPLAPWIAALAIGDRTLGAAGGWWTLRGRLLSFAGAYLAVVSPCFAVHLMLTMLLDAPGSTLAGSALIGIVFVDSAASLAQLVLTVALGVAAWRLHEAGRAR